MSFELVIVYTRTSAQESDELQRQAMKSKLATSDAGILRD